ncbi:MAG TPA: FCD domain-containing protein, partial [Limnochordia bacterium]|nr:FCD domain-containing protein [Limnochordia bacterium]
ELAAHRAVPDDLAALQAAYHDMAEARTRLDFAAFNQADIGFHHALLRASHNVVFEQLATTMSTALLYSFRMTIERAQEPGASLPNHGDVLDCIRARDGAGAFSAMSRLLDRALIDLGPPG